MRNSVRARLNLYIHDGNYECNLMRRTFPLVVVVHVARCATKTQKQQVRHCQLVARFVNTLGSSSSPNIYLYVYPISFI